MRPITHVFVDLDDTLAATSDVFHVIIQLVQQMIADYCHLNTEFVVQLFEQKLVEARESTGIDPVPMWWATLKGMQQVIGADFKDSFIEESFSNLMLIYEVMPQPLEGLVELLDYLEQQGTVVEVVTHARLDWTMRKLESLGLRERLAGHIHVVPVAGAKNMEAWLGAMDSAGANPKQVIGIGDSAKSDIIPLLEAGVPVESLFLVNCVTTRALFKQGTIPEAVRVVETLFELKQKLHLLLNPELAAKLDQRALR